MDGQVSNRWCLHVLRVLEWRQMLWVPRYEISSHEANPWTAIKKATVQYHWFAISIDSARRSCGHRPIISGRPTPEQQSTRLWRNTGFSEDGAARFCRVLVNLNPAPSPIWFSSSIDLPINNCPFRTVSRLWGTMSRSHAKTAAEQIETSTTSTSVSSYPFPNSNAGSTVETPATSGEDEEFQEKPTTKVMRTRGTRRKRPAESDGGDSSVSTKPATKRRASKRAVYVEIPVRSADVSVGIALTLVDRYRLS